MNVLRFVLLLFLGPHTALALACSCAQLSDKVYQIRDELENLREDVAVLSRKLSVNVGLRHDVEDLKMSGMRRTEQMIKLTADVRELQKRDQNTVSNLIQVVPGSTMEDLVNMVKRLAAQVSEMREERTSWLSSLSKIKEESAENSKSKISLLNALDDVRSELAHFQDKVAGISEVSQRLDALESTVSVDDSIFVELSTPEPKSTSDDAKDVTQIEFISADVNFTVNINDSGHYGCLEHINATDGSSSRECSDFRNATGEQDEAGGRSARTLRGEERTPLNRVLHLLVGKVKDVHENITQLNLTHRLRSLENAAQEVNRRLTTHHDGVMSDIEDVQNRVQELGFEVRNLTEEVIILREPQVRNGTEANGEWLQQLTTNHSEIRSLLDHALSKIGSVEHTLEHLTTENNATLRTLQALTGSLGTVSKRVEILNTSVEDKLKERLSDDELQSLRNVLDLKMAALNSVVNSSLNLMNRTIEKNIETLKERMDALQGALAEEEEKLKSVILNTSQASNMEMDLHGWHPNDSTPCPGLLFLGRDVNLVLTTDAGTFRSPKLSTEPLPVGSVVHFRCAHAGMFRLEGAETIRCFAGRWSSRPPHCQPLTTLQELRANNGTDNFPSITYETEDDAGYLVDERGRLVFAPGATIALTCLYPRSKGQVSWLHNGTVPKDATSAWLAGPDGSYAYRLRVHNASVEHSGVYACVDPGGKKHDVHVRVQEVFCEELEAPPGAAMDINHTGPMTMGTVVRFWCPLGHRLDGEAELSCSASGKWSAPVPSCPKIEDFSPPWNACSKPALPGPLSISPDHEWYKEGDRIQYKCHGGGMLIGKASSLCLQGRWIGNTPSCL
uniref:Putative p-selectin n=1 Tax=Ixodes ricinus TaxID=34613 RepID=A0A147BFX9_IXORI